MNSPVTSRFDYCNALLIAAPKIVLHKIQNVQNTVARHVTRTSRYTHITPILKQILPHTYKAQHDEFQNQSQQNRVLRSKELAASLVVPKSRAVMYGDLSFMTISPKMWNAVLASVRESKKMTSFKRSLKTHFFIQN